MSPFNLLVMIHISFYIILFSIFGSLQSVYFQTFKPSTIIKCERVLFVVLPIITIPLIISTLIEMNYIGMIPFYTSLLLIFLSYFYYTPLKSSYKNKKFNEDVSNEEMIQNRFECVIFNIISLTFPSITYISIFHNIITLNFDDKLNILTLISINLFYMALNSKNQLWYLENEYNKIKTTILLLSSLTILVWIENNIIFKRYGHFIKIQPPYSYFIISFGMLLFIGCFILLITKSKLSKKIQFLIILFISGSLFFNIFQVG
jgi:hypothetical protein